MAEKAYVYCASWADSMNIKVYSEEFFKYFEEQNAKITKDLDGLKQWLPDYANQIENCLERRVFEFDSSASDINWNLNFPLNKLEREISNMTYQKDKCVFNIKFNPEDREEILNSIYDTLRNEPEYVSDKIVEGKMII